MPTIIHLSVSLELHCESKNTPIYSLRHMTLAKLTDFLNSFTVRLSSKAARPFLYFHLRCGGKYNNGLSANLLLSP